MHYLITVISLLFATSLVAQEKLPLEYELQLAQQGLEWVAPEMPFRVQRYPEVSYQSCDFALRLPKEKLEIRYLFVPANEESDEALIPHLRAPRMAMHLASNEEDSYLTAHEVDPLLLDTLYQADWGETFFFRPKPMFSTAKNCQMLAIHLEGRGLCYVFMLFNDPPVTLPERAKMMRFRPEKLLD